MISKRISLLMLGILVCALIIYGWVKYDEGGPVPYPINTGSFYSIGSAFIDPEMLLEDVRNRRDPLFTNIQSDFPEDAPYVNTIGWSQNDYLDIAKVLHEKIWGDNPKDWHLYRASFYTGCESPDGEFNNNDDCIITVDRWPWGYDRNDWKVSYRSNGSLVNVELWVPVE